MKKATPKDSQHFYERSLEWKKKRDKSLKDLKSKLKKEELSEVREKPMTNHDLSTSRTNAPSTHTKSKKSLQPGPNAVTARIKKKNLENEMRAIDNYVSRMYQGKKQKELAEKAKAWRHYDPEKDISRSRSTKRTNSDIRTA